MYKIFFLCCFLTTGIIVGVLGQDEEAATTPVVAPPAPDTGTETPETTGSGSASGSEMSDMEFLDKYDEVAYATACKFMGKLSPDDVKLNLSRLKSLEDILKLTFLVKGQNLKAATFPAPESIKWKAELVDLMYGMFLVKCPNRFVKHEYIRIMHALSLVYLNSVESATSENMKIWEHLMSTLKSCEAGMGSEYNFTSSGLLIQNLIMSQAPPTGGEGGAQGATAGSGERAGSAAPDGGAGWSLTVPLSIHIEQADHMYSLDPIIDNLWRVFSHAWVTCLPTVANTDLWGFRFKQLFAEDFLAPLEERWKYPGTINDYLGLIMGDFDVTRMEYNSRYCLQAAYVTNSMEAYQLVRPIQVGRIDQSVAAFQNRKVGVA